MTLFGLMNKDPLPVIPATECRNPDAVLRIRDVAAAGRERCLIEAKRQRAVLVAAVKDYRMALEEWQIQRNDEVEYCQTGLTDATVCVRTPKRAWHAGVHE